MKTIYTITIILFFTGCAKYSAEKQKYLDAKQEYVNAKAVYQDESHILYELNGTVAQEVQFWKNERDSIKREFQ